MWNILISREHQPTESNTTARPVIHLCSGQSSEVAPACFHGKDDVFEMRDAVLLLQ